MAMVQITFWLLAGVEVAILTVSGFHCRAPGKHWQGWKSCKGCL